MEATTKPPTPFDALNDRLIVAISRIAATCQVVLKGVPEELVTLDRALTDAGVPSDDPVLWSEPAPNVETLYNRAVEVGVRVQWAIALSRVSAKGVA